MINDSQNKPAIPEIFLKPYDPAAHEKALYDLWEESGFFNPDVCVEKGITDKDAEVFSMVLPPPNVTGTLHMGSALMVAIEDVFVRHARMEGKKTLWVPGTDSAAIATQARVEKDIQKTEGKTRHDLGREELLKRIDTFVEGSKATILSQMRSIGASLDWSRYAYTLDQKRYQAVMEAFVRMYEAGLIYRGNRIVNWDPKGQTTIADDEIVRRLSGRLTCRACARTCHETSKPPARPGVCDACGGELFRRADDEPATIRQRVVVFHRMIGPLLDFYRATGRLVEIAAEGPVGDVSARVIAESKNERPR